MRILKLLSFIALLSFVFSCSKDDTNTDYASSIAGTYNGTFSVNGVVGQAGSSKLKRHSDTTVDLVITIGINSTSLAGLTISLSAKNVYSLTYSDPGGSFYGTVNGNKLDYSLQSGTDFVIFSGIK